jgi:outer membrane protein assembly factor BamB
MKELHYKTKLSTIAIILVLVISATLVALPITSAHDPQWTIETYCFINASPNPVGRGQIVYIGAWLDKVPPTAAGGNYGSRWHNITVTVTKPDGTAETLGPFTSDAAGGAWTAYFPQQIGTYTLQANFPGEVAYDDNPYPYPQLFPLGVDFLNDIYTASSSKVVELTVQEEPIEPVYQPNPFPTEYWERPIHSMNRNWYSLGGNWLGLGANLFSNTGNYDGNYNNFNPYTTAPASAHVLWTKSIAFGGQIGGEFGESELSVYATGTAYEAKFGAVIMYGILYYTDYPGAATNPGALKAVDLRTGEELWSVDAAKPLRFGMIYNFITGDQYGGHTYLFTAPSFQGFIVDTDPPVWSMYDAMTGEWILDIANASSAAMSGLYTGPRGEILSYGVSDNMLTMWNLSKCIEEGSWSQIYMSYSPEEIWRPPQGATIDWNGGYEWSVPLIDPRMSVSKVSDDVALLVVDTGGAFGGVPGGAGIGWRLDTGYSATTGELLWGPINRTLTQWANVNIETAGEGVYVEYTQQSMTWSGYSIKTGEKLWGPTEPYNSTWGYYDAETPTGVIGYGNLYTWSFNGEVHCYDIKSGVEKWGWTAGSAGLDTPYGVWPFVANAGTLADGKFYVASCHDYTPPLYKGAKLYCLDAYTGEEIWSILDFGNIHGTAIPVADGILVTKNSYDNLIYAYGKGPSKTTVTAPDIAVSQGTSVIIRGTVTDESPGTKSTLLSTRFPNGVSAVSDEYMSEWMEYLYQQQPKPDDVKGITVKLYAIDSNGERHDIGEATTDIWGNFGKRWKPPSGDDYQIVAEFEGTESYYGSSDSTFLTVGQASGIATEVAIILAVIAAAVICFIAYMLLKKHE